MDLSNVPIICISGYSGSGKTTLLEKLIPEISKRGVRVGTIKHHSHQFDMDKPGKDSYRHKKAGAHAAMIASPSQIGMVMDVENDHSPEELSHFFKGRVDIILAEGFKRSSLPKLEVHRKKSNKLPVLLDDPNLIAFISDVPMEVPVPLFGLEDIKKIADFILISIGAVK